MTQSGGVGGGATDAGARPLADVVAEGARVADGAASAGVALRLTGGVAVALRCESARSAPLARRYNDLDVVGRARDRKPITALLESLGYVADRQFNAVHGATRLFFMDEGNGRQLDVFLDRVELCHRIELADRLELEPVTLTLADLLLMKLQVVETNEKDLQDLVALLADHALGAGGIDIDYLAGLAAAEWGLWRTTTMVAGRAATYAAGLDGFVGAPRAVANAEGYVAALEAAPKTRGWRMRARVGERKRWYELPEEV